MARTPLFPLDRRQLLLGSGAGLLGLGLPAGLAQARTPSDLKFLFVIAYGGWDPTKVFATELNKDGVDLESDAELGSVGGITFVDHADRPSVREYFELHHAQTLLINGVLVPSVAHENCMRLMLTGTTAAKASDWPAILANPYADAAPLPHLVVAGPSYPGDLGGVVTRTGSSGQLEALMSGDILGWGDIQTSPPSARAEQIIDRYVASRVSSAKAWAQSARELEMLQAMDASVGRSRDLKDLLGVVNWNAGSGFGSQLDVAVDVLSGGISRCVTVQYSATWDTHTDNDRQQSGNFEGLFDGLGSLQEALARTPGTGSSESTLADEVVVIVMSEMGRTPLLNGGNGKDHWPYTSVMITGPGVTGDRVVGDYDDYFYGKTLDLETGELDADGASLACDTLGATLLTLAGEDAQAYLPGVAAATGLLSDG